MSFTACFGEFRRLSALLGRNDEAQRSALRLSDAEFLALLSTLEPGEPLPAISTSLTSDVAFQNYLMLLTLASSSALLDVGERIVAGASLPAPRAVACQARRSAPESLDRLDRRAFTLAARHGPAAWSSQQQGAPS